mmetsp:Transcript_20862/g.42355  ORF Transcript_20862/g.42355 Transcript_20862/m.42355 type:complete len:239 (-) Transcript_20862:481-1197(-)
MVTVALTRWPRHRVSITRHMKHTAEHNVSYPNVGGARRQGARGPLPLISVLHTGKSLVGQPLLEQVEHRGCTALLHALRDSAYWIADDRQVLQPWEQRQLRRQSAHIIHREVEGVDPLQRQKMLDRQLADAILLHMHLDQVWVQSEGRQHAQPILPQVQVLKRSCDGVRHLEGRGGELVATQGDVSQPGAEPQRLRNHADGVSVSDDLCEARQRPRDEAELTQLVTTNLDGLELRALA